MKQEVGVLVATQMGFCVVGVFLNNVAFITLKELPSMRASTYNILLCHIVLGTRCCIVFFFAKHYSDSEHNKCHKLFISILLSSQLHGWSALLESIIPKWFAPPDDPVPVAIIK